MILANLDFEHLRDCIKKSDYEDYAKLARAIGLQPGNFNKMLHGKVPMKMEHFQEVCRKIQVHPRQFFPLD